MSKTIGIAGLGWLGIPLAHRLSTLGYTVKGSVTSNEKASLVTSKGIDTYAIELSEQGVKGQAKEFLKDVSILIILIPPGIRRNTGVDFQKRMRHFLTEIEHCKVAKVILASSTAVYGDVQGRVTEKDLPIPVSQSGMQLLQVEDLFVNSKTIEVSIVRFGGLFGGSREPVRYLSGRKNLSFGNAPVNLIHRDDCIGIVESIIRENAFGYIFNAVSPHHPTKEQYYTRRADDLSLSPPHFSKEDSTESYKQVDSENLTLVLNYSFKHSL